MTWRTLLADASDWRQAPQEVRDAALHALAAELGAPWRWADGWMWHGDDAFLVVPGGPTWCGWSVEDVVALCRAHKGAVPAGHPWAQDVARGRPPTPVGLAPFLVARRAVRGMVEEDVADPFRLPTEAELEWVYRGCGRGGWLGVDPDVEVTPKNRARLLPAEDGPMGLDDVYDEPQLTVTDGVRRCRLAHTMWQDPDEEMVGVHAAAPGVVTVGTAWLRRVLPLPLDVSGPVPPLDESAGLVALLGSGKAADRRLATSALALLRGAPGADLLPVVTALLGARPDKDRALLDWLELLGDLAWGTTLEVSESSLALHPAIGADLPVDLLDHPKPAVRAAATRLAACAPEGRVALAERLEQESHDAVKTSLLLALARGGEDVVDRCPEGPVRVLASALIGRADPDEVVALGSGRVQLRHVPWFGGDLSAAALAWVVARPDRKEVARTLARSGQAEVAARLVFEDRSRRPANDPGRYRLLRADELSDVQRDVLSHAGGARLQAFGIPFDAGILLGTSPSPWAVEVRPGVTRLHDLMDVFAEAAAGDREGHRERVLALVATLSVTERMALHDASAPLTSPAPGIKPQLRPWPFVGEAGVLALLDGTSAADRATYAAALEAQGIPGDLPLPRRRELLVRWAGCLDEGQRLPEPLVAAVDEQLLFVVDEGARSVLRAALPPEVVGARARRAAEATLDAWRAGGSVRTSSGYASLVTADWVPGDVVLLLAARLTERFGTELYVRLRDDPTLEPLWGGLPDVVAGLVEPDDGEVPADAVRIHGLGRIRDARRRAVIDALVDAAEG